MMMMRKDRDEEDGDFMPTNQNSNQVPGPTMMGGGGGMGNKQYAPDNNLRMKK